MDYYIINKLQQAEQSFIFKSIKLFINIREKNLVIMKKKSFVGLLFIYDDIMSCCSIIGPGVF